MTAHPEPLHWHVSSRDPDFTVRVARFDDLVRLQREAEEIGMTARWSSPAALERQVDPATTVLLAPVLRNGRFEPASYRCHIWFVPRANPYARTVSLFDVTASSLSALREAATPGQLRLVARMLLDGIGLDPIS
ncbi:hypothetical protein [Dactylosporangium sp. CA-139066]|uniref:hypothetical protein n=1 Tax=Dactylosporangium sp. CA-139066 TaxID=3239930 RepID=UPI003D90D281